MTLFPDNPFEKMMIQKPSRNAEKKCGETSFCVVK